MVIFNFNLHLCTRHMGSFTYYVISRVGGVSKCLRLITGGGGGGGGLAVDYVITILIFTLE